MSELVGKSAVVTGAGQGLGYDIAAHLLAAGSDVLVFDLDGDRAGEAAERLSDDHRGRRALPFAGDVSDEADVRAAFDLATDELGTPRILVNNALYNVLSPIVTLPLGEWQRVYDVIARGTFLGTRELGRRFMEQELTGGAIVNISTLNYSVATTGLAAYCSSKAAVSQFTKAAALEYAALGIRVNAIAPGLIDTPLARRFLGDQPEVAQAFIDRTPMARIGQTADMAKVVVFLASHAAGWITGVTLNVDGGMHLEGVPDNWQVMKAPLGMQDPTPADWLGAGPAPAQ
jgi:NAD(P)-dependent dehydrogenase (short-subunit alcohol dehydrogenase family)